MVRYIGIRHRVKRTSKGEARPTQVAILEDKKAIRLLNLKTDEDELDLVVGRFPTRWRVADPDEDLSGIFPRHVRRRKKRGSEEFETIIPRENSYEGFRKDDIIAMALGGSGDKLAFALSRQAEKIGAKVLRIPPFILMERREAYGYKKDDPKDDARILVELVFKELKLFYPVTPRDRRLILVRETYRARVRAMKARIACQQRLRQRLIGKIFCSEDGLYPEGEIEDLFKAEKANDEELRLHVEKEKALIKELRKALENLDIYTQLFKPIEGCGPVLAAPLISEICDIRRFATAAKLKAFCGVHVLPDGRFPRQRRGELTGWEIQRLALFLLGNQFNRRPNSVWGKRLLKIKREFRRRHPEVVIVKGKKRYTDGHILNMALWRTLTKFIEWLFREWWKLEREHQRAKEIAA